MRGTMRALFVDAATLVLCLAPAACRALPALANHSTQASGTSSAQPARPTAASQASILCSALPQQLRASAASTLVVESAFSHWYEAGSHPSLELLTATYPSGWIPSRVDPSSILPGVGPDIDLTADAGYGRNGQNRYVTNHGPLGGLPSFCRLGANIRTSDTTVVLSEVWLPLADGFAYGESSRNRGFHPLAPINASDFPTNSTPVEFAVERAAFLRPEWQKLFGNATVYDQDDPVTKFSYNKAPSNKAVLPLSLDRSQHKYWWNDTEQLLNGQAERRSSHTNRSASHSSSLLTGAKVFGNGASTAWNGRILFLANGGQRGWVPWPDMAQQLSRHRFVTAGTTTGHFSSTSGVSWMTGSRSHRENSAKDWTSRASHVTIELARASVDLFYGPTAGVRGGTSPWAPAHQGSNRVRTYFAGCSVGGRNALASAQVYPGDVDGIFAGSPAYAFNRMNAGQIHTQSVFNETCAGNGTIEMPNVWAALHETVLKQCGNDAGIVVDELCARHRRLDLKTDLLCDPLRIYPDSLFGHNKDQCLTLSQVNNLKRMFEPATVPSLDTNTNVTVYPAYLPGSERAVATATGRADKAKHWYQLAVFGWAEEDEFTWNPYANLTWQNVEQGEMQNIGGSNAEVKNLSPFFHDQRRKLIMTHGLADLTISPLSSREYFEGVHAQSTHPSGDVSDSYRYFEVPGMLHCRDGDGAWHFGSPTQNDPGNRPLRWDTEHDVLLRLVAWTEKGPEYAPQYQVGAGYATLAGQTKDQPPAWFEQYSWGVRLTRKLCPYPQRSHYIAGPRTGKWAHESYVCA